MNESIRNFQQSSRTGVLMGAAAVVSVLLVLCAPAAQAAQPGVLTQLPGAGDCVSETADASASCGTQIPFGTHEAFQVQVTVEGRNAYSVSVGGDVIEYTRNPTTGALTVIGCLTAREVLSGSKGPACDESGGELTEMFAGADGATALALVGKAETEQVYVVSKGHNELAELERNEETGLLTPIETGGKPACATSETASPTGCNLSELEFLQQPYGIVVAPNEKYVFVAGTASESIAEFFRNEATGVLTRIGPDGCIGTSKAASCPNKAAEGLIEPIGMAVDKDSEDLYVASGASKELGAITELKIAGGGELEPLAGKNGCISEGLSGCTAAPALQGSEDITISPDGNFLYATSANDKAVVALERKAGGALAELPGAAGCITTETFPATEACALAAGIAGSRGLALSPEGEDLYVGSASEDTVAAFERNATTGALKQFEDPYECVTSGSGCDFNGLIGLQGARRLVVSPDGRNVYVAGQEANAIVELERAVTPVLTEVQPKQGSEAGAEEVTIEGTGFQEGDRVFFGEAEAPQVTVNSTESITAVTPAAGAGPETVTVENIAGRAEEPSHGRYTFLTAAKPTVTGLEPSSGAETDETTVTIYGSEFYEPAVVFFGGVQAVSSTVDSGNKISAVAPRGSGVVDVTVQTPKGTSATSSADRFHYTGGGLNLAGYCATLGDPKIVLLRGEVEGPEYAYENWACVTPSGTDVLFTNHGAAPSMAAACGAEYPGVATYAYPENPNNAYTWDCHVVSAPPLEVERVPPSAPPAKIASIEPSLPAPVTAPVLAKSGNVAPLSGTVLVRLPGSTKFVALTTLTAIPFGTVIDATKGHVVVTTAAPHGGTQTGEFFDGEFILTQGKNGLVVATLTGGSFAACPTARERAHKTSLGARVATASRKHIVRKLWTNAHGSFSTKGNYAAGAVAGTEWLTEDLCDGTLIRVTRDKVKVTNFVTHHTKIVKVGHSYTAAAPS